MNDSIGEMRWFVEEIISQSQGWAICRHRRRQCKVWPAVADRLREHNV